jgi:hypothetical protein
VRNKISPSALVQCFLEGRIPRIPSDSDGGLIPVRELDERLGLEKLIEEQLSDSRQGLNKQFTLADLVRQSAYSRLAGYEDLNDAERLATDPMFRLISSQRIWDRGAASAARQQGEERAQRGSVREMPWNGRSSRLQVSANQADGPPRAATKSICFTRKGLRCTRAPSGRSKWKSWVICVVIPL